MINRILFTLFRPFARFNAYASPTAVGGWLGWYTLGNRCLAFEDADGGLFFDF